MYTKKDFWELEIVDALPPAVELHSFIAGKIEKDGPNVMVTGGMGGLFLYYGQDHNRVTVAEKGFFHVGLTLEDVDGDGIKEIITSEQVILSEHIPVEELRKDKSGFKCGNFKIVGYKMGKTYEDEWTKFEIDPLCMGNPHDIYFTDIDGDGRNEMIAVSAYSITPGLYLYQNSGSIDKPWTRTPIMEGHLTEGIAVADLNNDGKLEIVSGPDWYVMPKDGPFSGEWERSVYAPTNRDMCRVALLDLTGNGKLDIISVESEYLEGRLCWYENFTDVDKENPWKEHFIDEGYTFAHSLRAYIDEKTGENRVFLAEMVEGGWEPPINFDAEINIFTVSDCGKTWIKKEVYHGVGTHQTILYDIDNDGELEVVGKSWQYPTVHIFKEKTASKILNFQHSFIDRDKINPAHEIFALDINGDGIEDVVCADFWYKAPNWDRYKIPNIYEVINHYDIDNDGMDELISIKKSDSNFKELCWLKAVDVENGIWEEYEIGNILNEISSSLIDILLPNNKLGFALTYKDNNYPEIFEIPKNPKERWTKRTLVELDYHEDIKIYNTNENDYKNILAGNYLLINKGDGSFEAQKLFNDFVPVMTFVTDIHGRLDIVSGENSIGEKRRAKFARLAWFDSKDNYKMNIIDIVRCAHSINAFDIDNDGELELLVGEHDISNPYRNRTRLYIYKKADKKGLLWTRYTIDDRFDHRNGVKTIKLKNGNVGIISHSIEEKQFIHLWEFKK